PAPPIRHKDCSLHRSRCRMKSAVAAVSIGEMKVFLDRWLVLCALAMAGVLASAGTGFAQADTATGGDDQTIDAAPAKPEQKASKKKKQDEWEVRWSPQPTVRFGR